MNFQEYIEFTRDTAIYPDSMSHSLNELMYLGLGLASEAGEVAGVIKKAYRDGIHLDLQDKMIAEIGDVFWYLIRLCDAMKLNPEDVISMNMDKLRNRMIRGRIGGDGDNR